MSKVGILEDVVAAGFKNSEGLCFRTPFCGSNEVLAKIPPGKAPQGSIDYGVQLGQPKLTAIIRKHALANPHFSLHYRTRFLSLQEDADFAHVDAMTTEGDDNNEKLLHLSARFVIGCDGAGSSVRKAAGIPFEGFTWEDWRFVAVNIRYDFAAHGYPAANHVVDPQDWAVVVRASRADEGLWRVATGIPPELPPAEIEKYVVAKLESLMPGPRPLKYEIEAISPYWAHERVARTFRAGRVVLCGDAAHINNPLTALGLTTGLVDVAVLTRVLPAALAPETSAQWSSLLNKYAFVRRKDFIQRVQKQTIAGKLRIHSTDPKVVAEREDFFNMLNKSPGFAMFIASLMMEPLPEELWPSSWMAFVSSIRTAFKFISTVALILFWKINAALQ
ncbi:hypothetical protein SLS57_011259 [Botryosphaeria dothidea]